MTAQARSGADPHSGSSLREVGQGAMAVSADPRAELTATLGSCVSVCLFSPDAACGGMNHIYRSVGPGQLGHDAVVAEIECLVNALMRLGASRSGMLARLTGGAQVLTRKRAHGLAIADACLTYLTTEGFEVVGVSVGGRRARRIRYHPVSGKLAVGLLAELQTDDALGPVTRGNAPEMF